MKIQITTKFTLDSGEIIELTEEFDGNSTEDVCDSTDVEVDETMVTLEQIYG